MLSGVQPLFMNIYFPSLWSGPDGWLECHNFGKQTIKSTGWIRSSPVGVVFSLSLHWATAFDTTVPIFSEVTLSRPHDVLPGGLAAQLPGEARGTFGEMVTQWTWWWCANICCLQHFYTKGPKHSFIHVFIIVLNLPVKETLLGCFPETCNSRRTALKAVEVADTGSQTCCFSSAFYPLTLLLNRVKVGRR